MATVVDAARDADATVNCAVETYGDAFDIGFVINATADPGDLETELGRASGTGTPNSTDAGWVPVIDFSSFWLANTAATERFT